MTWVKACMVDGLSFTFPEGTTIEGAANTLHVARLNRAMVVVVDPSRCSEVAIAPQHVVSLVYS